MVNEIAERPTSGDRDEEHLRDGMTIEPVRHPGA